MALHAGRDSLFSLVVGPVLWGAHFLTVYFVTAIHCAKGWPYVGLTIAVATLVAVGMIVLGGWIAWRRWHGEDWDGDWIPAHDTPDLDSRRRFLAYAALLLCGASLIATVWEALPALFMESCR